MAMAFRLGHPPKWKEEFELLLMENGGKADANVVDHLRWTVDKDAGNLDALWALGLACYDVKDYSASVETFQKLNALTEKARDKWAVTMHDWSYIWMGHMYDLMGERERAVAEYKKVLSSTTTMQMSQYRIGPITAGEWARQRIEKPFERR
jgi:tetratricopeptide (TPR) repeat protein